MSVQKWEDRGDTFYYWSYVIGDIIGDIIWTDERPGVGRHKGHFHLLELCE